MREKLQRAKQLNGVNSSQLFFLASVEEELLLGSFRMKWTVTYSPLIFSDISVVYNKPKLLSNLDTDSYMVETYTYSDESVVCLPLLWCA